jgi:hypothetical protein
MKRAGDLFKKKGNQRIERFVKNMKPPEETDTFQYEPFYSLVAKRQRIIWDYRDKKGILHSGVVDSLGEAFEKGRKFGYQSNEAAIVRIV